MSRTLIALLLLVGTLTPHSVSAQAPSGLTPRRLDNADLAFVLLYGSAVDLAKLPGGDAQPLRVRLWRTDVERSCGPAGHLICAYQYHLAVGAYGEGGDQAVYDLGEFGTIQSLRWLTRPSGDRAFLELSALNFTAHVFPRWAGLKREQWTAVLDIGTDSIRVTRKR